MNTSIDKSTSMTAGTAPRARIAGPGDGLQVVVGYYTLYQGEDRVGLLNVVEGTAPNSSVEHWGLFSTYHAPSSLNPSQELRFEYEGAPLSQAAFESELPSGTTYVVASCSQTIIP